MDSFEFVQIPVAIVLGFGISEILAGWGHQLRHRHEHPLFVRLATTACSRDQWIGWSVNWAVLLILLAVIVPDLAPTNP